MTTTGAQVPLRISVAAVVRANELLYTEAGEIIDSFIGISASHTIRRAVNDKDDRLLRRLAALRRPEDQSQVFCALTRAAEDGLIHVFEVLYPYCPVDDSRSTDSTDSTEPKQSSEGEAPSNILAWANERGGGDFVAYLVAKATTHNQVETVKWLLAHLPDGCSSLTHDDRRLRRETAMAIAAKNGQLELLQLFHASAVGGWLGTEVTWAAEGGHSDVVQWLIAHRPLDEWGSYYFGYAVENDQLDVIQSLHSKGIMLYEENAMVASMSSNLDMIKWFLAHCPDEFGRHALGGAVRQRHLHIAKYLYQCGVKLGRISSSSMDWAASTGGLDVIKWVYEHRNENERCTIYGLMEAARRGHLSIVEVLHERGMNLSMVGGTRREWFPLWAAASSGHLDIVKYILEHDTLWFYDDESDDYDADGNVDTVPNVPVPRKVECTVEVMNAAASSGHLDIVQYLHENCAGGCTTKAMDGAARGGHLDVVKYLHEHRTEGCTTDAMNKAAGMGHLEVVQFLHSNRSEGCTTNALRWATEQRKGDVVQWLEDNLPEGYMTEAADPDDEFF